MSTLPESPKSEVESTSDGDRSEETPLGLLGCIRVLIAGVLMGVANLIPGVSGGTMILAMGVYQDFIDSVADVTAFRWKPKRLLFLGLLALAVGVSIVGLAGVILDLLFSQTVAMFALFIGLTLGGVPLLLKSVQPVRLDVIVGAMVGLGLMVGLLMLRDGLGIPHSTPMDVLSGVIGSMTMVLPGISGSYVLFVLGQYDHIVGSVRDLRDGLRGGTGSLAEPLQVLIPVAIGAVVGIVALSNLLKILLHRYQRATIGVLLGILLGSVIGLWPFDQQVGEKALENQDLEALQAYAERWHIPDYESHDDVESLVRHIDDHWDQRVKQSPKTNDIIVALVMIAVGFGLTFGLAQWGARLERGTATAGEPSEADSK